MARIDQERNSSDLRVGTITFIALVLLITGILFAGGDKGLLFGKLSHLSACLNDVGGLKRGSTVTTGGMTIGKVIGIEFSETRPNLIEVSMVINSKFRGKIKTDSVPYVKTQGMLGDRYVEITMGSETAKILPENQELIGKGASDFDAALRQTSSVLGEADLLLKAINQRQGTVGQMFYNEELYKTLTTIAEQVRDLLTDFKAHPKRYVKLSII